MPVYQVKFRVSGSRMRTIVLQAETADAARRHVCDLVTHEQVENNLFLNLDRIEVNEHEA